jgi:hypothetical protein
MRVREGSVQRTIIGYERDEEGEVIALLTCGHRRHVRHRPPFEARPWVTTAEGRAARVGTSIECGLCDQESRPR